MTNVQMLAIAVFAVALVLYLMKRRARLRKKD
jgi:hypothetical protein